MEAGKVKCRILNYTNLHINSVFDELERDKAPVNPEGGGGRYIGGLLYHEV